MYREVKNIKLESSIYMISVIIFILFNYYAFVFCYLEDMEDDGLHKTIIFIVFHMIFGMAVWSIIRSIISDPGKVPIFWGFFFDDPESKKRRYCLICHIFKVILKNIFLKK